MYLFLVSYTIIMHLVESFNFAITDTLFLYLKAIKKITILFISLDSNSKICLLTQTIQFLPPSILTQYCSNCPSIDLTSSGSKSQVLLQNWGPRLPAFEGQTPWMVHESGVVGIEHECEGFFSSQSTQTVGGQCCVKIRQLQSLPPERRVFGSTNCNLCTKNM